jgi:hypothetical protein
LDCRVARLLQTAVPLCQTASHGSNIGFRAFRFCRRASCSRDACSADKPGHIGFAESERRSGLRPKHELAMADLLLPPLRAIHFGTVRFNDKPTARHKCGPGWERFTTRLDVAKLNMMLSSGSLETGTGSSNSLRSASESSGCQDSLISCVKNAH